MTSLKCVKKTDFKIESILFQQLNIKRRRRRQHCYNNDDDVTRTQGGELGLLKKRKKSRWTVPETLQRTTLVKNRLQCFGDEQKFEEQGLEEVG